MVFTISYRHSSGSLQTETIEAEDRTAAFAQMQARGITPVSVTAGGKLSATPKTAAAVRPSWVKGAVVGGLVVVAGVVALLCLTSTDKPAPATVEKPKPIKPARTNVVVRPVQTNPPPQVVVKPVETNTLPPWDDAFMMDGEKRRQYSTLFQASTNEGGLVVERFRLPNGKTWRRIVEPPPVFSNASDNVIAMVVGGAAGAPIPPVPGLDSVNLNEEFVRSLDVPIEISPDDKPSIAALKLAVKETRAEIEQLIKDGDTRSVGEILSEHISLNNLAAAMQADALRMVEKVRAEGGDEMAEEYLQAVNENLKKYGVGAITIGRGRRQLQEDAAAQGASK